MKGLKLIVVVVGIMCLILSQVSWAEEKDEGVIRLEEIVVTATKTEKRAIDVSASITVITGEELEELGVRNVRDVLQYKTPSIYPQSYGYGDGVMKIRGFTGNTNQVKVLIDGVPQLKETHGARFETVPTEQIERIEVVRGPGSVLYGSGAMGGVINIITKKKAVGPTASLKIQFGPDNTETYSIQSNVQKGDTSFSLFASRDESDGWRKQTACEIDNIRFTLNTLPDPSSTFTLSVSYHETDSEYGGALWKDDFEHHPETSYNPEWHCSREEKWGLVPIYQTSLTDKIDFIARGHLDKLNRTSKTSYEYIYDSDGEGLEFQTNFKHAWFGRKNTLTIGVAGEREAVVQDKFKYPDGVRGDIVSIKDIEVLSGALYVQDDIWLTSRLNLVLGGRYEVFDFDKDNRLDATKSASSKEKHFCPKLGITFKLNEKTSVYGNISDSFQYPRWWRLTVNPDIDPEEGTSYELGLKGLWGDKIGYAFAVYQSDMDNEVEYNREWPERYRNVGETRHRGFEFEGNYEVLRGLSIGLAYAWLDVEVLKNEVYPEYEGKEKRLCPENTVGCNISYRSAWGFSGTFAVNWVDESYIDRANELTIDDYFESMARIGYDWKNFNLSFNVTNLFDEDYAKSAYESGGEPKYYPMPDRRCMLEFNIRF